MAIPPGDKVGTRPPRSLQRWWRCHQHQSIASGRTSGGADIHYRSNGHAPTEVPPVLPRVEPPELDEAEARTSPVATHISKQRSDIHLLPTPSPTVCILGHDNSRRRDIILSPAATLDHKHNESPAHNDCGCWYIGFLQHEGGLSVRGNFEVRFRRIFETAHIARR